MNNQSFDIHNHEQEPILKIWRDMKAREQLETQDVLSSEETLEETSDQRVN